MTLTLLSLRSIRIEQEVIRRVRVIRIVKVERIRVKRSSSMYLRT